MSYFEKLRDHFLLSISKLKQDDDYHYLYKHFSFGPKDSDFEFNVLRTFTDSCLLYSKPKSFNDPYDSVCKIEYDLDPINRKVYEKIFNEKISPAKFATKKQYYKNRLNSHEYVKNWGKYNRDYFHVTCFNNNPLSILMWSHYAEYHQGFMVEFKFSKTKDYKYIPLPVFYENEFPIVKKYPINLKPEDCLKNNEMGAEVTIKFFSTKAECWSYENEFRQVPLGNTLTEINEDKIIAKFDCFQFSSVVFGALISEKRKQKLIEAVEEFNNKFNQNIQCYQARMVDYEYRLEVPDHPRF